MKLDKKQLPQLAVLGVLLVGGIGFVTFQLTSGDSAKPVPVKKADSPAASAPAPTEAGDLVAQLDPAAGTQTVVTRRDPFQPVKLPIDPTSVLVIDKPQIAPKQHNSRPPAFSHGNARVPAINTTVGPFNPFSHDTNTPSGVRPIVVEEKDPEFALTGIVRGEQNVAVIRVGESGRYIVKQGQLVEGRYRVISVTPESVTLACKGRRIEIKLGGVKNAS